MLALVLKQSFDRCWPYNSNCIYTVSLSYHFIWENLNTWTFGSGLKRKSNKRAAVGVKEMENSQSWLSIDSLNMQVLPFLTPGGTASSFLLVASLPSHTHHFMHLSLSTNFIGPGNRELFTWSCFQAFSKQLAHCRVLLLGCSACPWQQNLFCFESLLTWKIRGAKGLNQIF